MIRLFFLPLTLFLIFSQSAIASDGTVAIDHILKQDEAPAGIVFEIVSDDEDFLDEILPDLKIAISKLRQKFPDLSMAIVTHGKEQFALASSNSNNNKNAHSLTKELVKDDIDVHVCGTHAGWYGVSPEDFPDYVDVSPAGPTQIDDYEEMGYELIFLTD